MALGFKYAASKKVSLIYSENPFNVAGVFTQNKCAAAPVLYTKNIVENHKRAQSVVINSGNANAATGKQGESDVFAMSRLVSEKLGLTPEQTLVASTGKIGVNLDMNYINENIDVASRDLSDKNIEKVAQAILTTDTRVKIIKEKVGETSIVGIAKGSGMIHPNMATMLAFIMTDAQIESSALQNYLQNAVSQTFNMVTVDGDTSTNDMCLLLANGIAGDVVDHLLFQEKLLNVCKYLAKEIVRDGEGATKLIEVIACNACSKKDAILVAKTVASSPLVKTAVCGADPNWGRVVAAVGRSGAAVDVDKIDIEMLYLSSPEPKIIIDLGLGKEIATAWGCDLTKEYININTKYN